MNREIVIQDRHVAWWEGELELSRIPMLWIYPPQTPPQSRSSELKTQFSFESSENILQNRRKIAFWPNFGTIRGQKGPENLAHRGHFLHTPEITRNMPLNQVSRSDIKNFPSKWPKIPIFCN